jgi:glyceraldehyde 3-phosphate dehydrogenase
VLESTGIFRTSALASKHLKAGAKKVVLSAPPKSEDIKSVVMGVNEEILDGSEKIISNASCTTNSAAPLVKVMKTLGTIENAYITTIHSYTSDQKLHDAPHADLRRARAAAESIVPTTTGAAKAITKIFPELDGHIGGCGIRVPVPDGSLTDMTFIMDHDLTVDEVNAAFKKAAEGDLKGILKYEIDPIVSSDVIGNSHSSTFDAELTSIIGKMVKVVAWYDNEAGYSNRCVDLIAKIG